MALVDYSDSDQDSQEGQDPIDQPQKNISESPQISIPKPKLKRKFDLLFANNVTDVSAKKSLPPIPSTFHNLYATNVRASNQDDPALHGGRTRQAPHVEGNWPTHVYLEWNPLPKELDVLSSFVSDIQRKASQLALPVQVRSLLRTDLDVQAPLHISLSRSLVFSSEQRNPFAEALSVEINLSEVESFYANISGAGWAPNFERNRWFLVLRLNKPPHNELNKLLAASNSAAAECGQPPLYAVDHHTTKRQKTPGRRDQFYPHIDSIADCTDSFHVSIAWTLEDPSTSKLEPALSDTARLKDLVVYFDCVKLKVGNTVESISLAKPLPVAGIAGL